MGVFFWYIRRPAREDGALYKSFYRPDERPDPKGGGILWQQPRNNRLTC